MVAAMLAAVDPAALPVADADESLPRLAHKLKGSSAAMGATGLAGICHRLEEAPAAPVDLADVLHELEAESARVRAAVARLLAASGPDAARGAPTIGT